MGNKFTINFKLTSIDICCTSFLNDNMSRYKVAIIYGNKSCVFLICRCLNPRRAREHLPEDEQSCLTLLSMTLNMKALRQKTQKISHLWIIVNDYISLHQVALFAQNICHHYLFYFERDCNK